MNDPRLADLLHDAVADVEPSDRIVELRVRTANPARTAARPWFYAAGGVVLATAAAVAGFAVLGNNSSTPDHEHHHDVVSTPTPATKTELVAAYYVGDTPRGPRLYREFDQVPIGDPLQGALDQIQRPATDPDYTTPWPNGSFDSVTLGDGTIDVEVGDAVLGQADGLPIQQVVYTLRGAAALLWPVRFLQDGEPLITVDALPENDVLSLMSISDPADGNAYHGSFTARGRANSFEGAVRWEIRDEAEKVVASGHTTALGFGTGLFKWEDEVDVSDLPYGFYTFVALNDDPSSGEGFAPDSDTRRIIVR